METVSAGFCSTPVPLRDSHETQFAEPFAMAEIGVFTSAKGNLHQRHGNAIRDALISGMKKARVHLWEDASIVTVAQPRSSSAARVA